MQDKGGNKMSESMQQTDLQNLLTNDDIDFLENLSQKNNEIEREIRDDRKRITTNG